MGNDVSRGGVRLLDALIAGFSVLAALAPIALHRLIVTGQGMTLTVGLVGMQVVALAVVWFRSGRPRRWVPVGVIAIGGLVMARATGVDTVLLLAAGTSHAVIFGGLCIAFGASLRPGRDDVVTALARRLNPAWTIAMAGYTRGVTWAWTGFFAAQVVISLLLFLLASREVWSLFVNILDIPLVALMFAGEFLLRRRRFPGQPYVGPARIIAAMRAGTPR